MCELNTKSVGLGTLVERMRRQWRTAALGFGAALILVVGTQLLPHGWSHLWSLPRAAEVIAGTAGAILVVLALLPDRAFKLRGHLKDKPLGAVIAAAWITVICLVLLIIAGAWWLLGTPRIVLPEELQPSQVSGLITRAFAIVTGLGAVAFLVIAYRRQQTTENGEKRENTKLFTERFTTAVGQLGDDQPAVRLGGVHALAHLADEAPPEREDLVQMVIDVLCAYLRIPSETAPMETPEDPTPQENAEYRQTLLKYSASREVRRTIVRIIGNRLREDEGSRWRGKDYDFTNVEFDGGDFHGAHFTGGRVSFGGARFTGGVVDFREVRFRGAEVDFTQAEFDGARVLFDKAQVTSGGADFTRACFQSGSVSFSEMCVLDGRVFFLASRFEGAEVDFTDVRIDGGRMLFGNARFQRGSVAFDGLRITAGLLSFKRARLSNASLTFDEARFEGGEVKFAPLRFGGPLVNFAGVVLCGSRVTFIEVLHSRGTAIWATGPAPAGIVKAAEKAPFNTAPLPLEWYEEDFQKSPTAPAEESAPAPDEDAEEGQ
ncbi:pentapeptide repeat-containing protein [Nocardiopsis dassonvillei]|uniref:pentapeptide repeat-containing protein n=1 Tax=Nocardiopsis dassonvillei TaxID=2014 RepID=UPI003F56C49B